MKAVLNGRKLFLAVLTAVSLLGVGTLAVVNPDVFAGPPKQDYSLSATSDTVSQPTNPDTAQAEFTITVVPNSAGYPYPVVFSASGLPKGVSLHNPAWSKDGATATPDDPKIDLMVDVASTVKVGTYTFTVTGKNATTLKDAHDVKATLGVAAPTSSGSGFSLTLNPTQRTVQPPASTTYGVQLLPTASFNGTVALTTKGLPGGTSASFSPTSLAKTANPGTTVTTSTLTVLTTSKTHAGVYHFTVEGISGKTRYDVVAQLTIQATPGSTGFSLALSPSQQQIAAGASTSFAVGIARNNFDGEPVTLSVSGLPKDAQASFDINPATGDGSTMTITTNEVTTPDGNFEFTVTGTSDDFPTMTSSVKGHLVVNTPPGKTFGISGTATGMLYPGGDPAQIDLTLSNPNDKPILITSLVVTVTGTNHPPAPDYRGCLPSDFTVTQYAGGYPLRLEKKSTQTLSGMGVSSAQLPTVAMNDLSTTNQDDCKNATVNLSYSGNAREAG